MDPVDREAARRSVPAASEIEISREVFVFVLRTRTGAAELPLDGDRPSVEVDVRPGEAEHLGDAQPGLSLEGDDGAEGVAQQFERRQDLGVCKRPLRLRLGVRLLSADSPRGTMTVPRKGGRTCVRRSCCSSPPPQR